MYKSMTSHRETARLPLLLALLPAALLIGCPGDTGNGTGDVNSNDNDGANQNVNQNSSDGPPAARWQRAFDSSNTGDLSGVWGSGPDDVFVIGGTPEQGEVYHYDGKAWEQMLVPRVPLLVWICGFGPDDVYAVGEGGGAIHYNGNEWTVLETGETQALWGVWGSSPDDIWIVGGDVGVGDPVILRYDRQTFTPVPVPENDRLATSLFKVWGIGSKIFAVGERGLILQFADGEWFQVPAGAAADDDFVSLWGTSEQNIVAVGGRGSARVATYDGNAWTTRVLSGIPGLNAVFTDLAEEAVVGGSNGYVGLYRSLEDELLDEVSGTGIPIHAAWGDGSGRVYAVGGRFSPPHTGIALVRTMEGDFEPTVPLTPVCASTDDCPVGMDCVNGTCMAAPPGQCASNDDCDDGQICEGGSCKSGAGAVCGQDADCAAGLSCLESVCADGTGAACGESGDCPFGQDCSGGRCTATTAVRLELGQLNRQPYAPVPDGGEMTLFRGFQGGSHVFATLHASGLSVDADAELSWTVTSATGQVLSSFTVGARFRETADPNVIEIDDEFVAFDRLAGTLDGTTVDFSFTLTVFSENGILDTATLERTAVLCCPECRPPEVGCG